MEIGRLQSLEDKLKGNGNDTPAKNKLIFNASSLLGFAGDAHDPESVTARKLPANENASDCTSSFLDLLNAAKQQLLKGGNSSST